MLTLALLMFGSSLVCLAIGLWGECIRTEVHCGHCGYDLAGIDRSPQTVCPECGGGIWTGAVLQHIRRANARMIRLSLVLFAVALSVIGLRFALRLSGVEWSSLLTTEGLKDRIELSNDAVNQDDAWRELLKRRNAGRLGEDDLQDIAAIAMDRHLFMIVAAAKVRERLKDRPGIPAPWPELGEHHAEWLSIVCNQRLVDDERIAAYVEELLRPVGRASVSSYVVRGQEILLGLHVFCNGKGGYESAEFIVWLDEIMVDDSVYRPDGWTPEVDTASIDSSGAVRDGLWLSIPLDLEPGLHKVTVQLRWGITQAAVGRGSSAFDAGGMLRANDKWPATLWETTTTDESTVEVRPAPTEG